LESRQIEGWQRQKRVCVALLTFTSITLLLGLGARFIPIINDWISGPAQPMHAIAEEGAKAIATATANEYPVIVTKAEDEGCRSAQPVPSPYFDDVVYVLAYSERARSYCLTIYEHFPGGSMGANVVTLNEDMGQNYGRRLPVSVKAVPVKNHLAVYPQRYLSLLYWRAKVVFPLTDMTGLNAHGHEFAPTTQNSTGMGVELNFQEMRAIVARRHDSVNRALSATLEMLAVLAVVLALWMGMIYRSFREHGRRYSFAVSLRMYLREDLNAIQELAQRHYLLKQQEIHESLRAENMFKHSVEQAREKLQFLLQSSPDERIRTEIERCLERNQLEEMRHLFRQFQDQASQKTYEERLALLLESLKPYCPVEEFEQYRNQAFTHLDNSGFRQARDFVVRMHDELKLKSKEPVEDVSFQDLAEAERTEDAKNSGPKLVKPK